MHPALQIPEILLNIFGHRHPANEDSQWYCKADAATVAALARTCRAFKEPALDILWEALYTLSPLARCVPEASRKTSGWAGYYCFCRPLTQAEWDTLRSYTRRVRYIRLADYLGLNRKPFITLSKPPGGEPLFLNVRHLRFDYPEDRRILSLPFPSLVSLDILLNGQRSIERCLRSLAKITPSITRLSILPHHHASVDMDTIDPKMICHWKNLRSFHCQQMPLDITTFMHLSRMPTLACLGFTLRSTLPDQIPLSDSPLVLSKLDQLFLCSESLDLTSRLLSKIQLPAITEFSNFTLSHPSKRDLSRLLAGIRLSGDARGVQEIWLSQSDEDHLDIRDIPVLVLGDLRPCMAFRNLRRIYLDIEWNVDLTDSELLKLASTWPHLEEFLINKGWGWNTSGGITPNGLIQLLQTCPDLTRVALAIDTRSYTEIPPSPPTLGLTLASLSYISVVDSCIEEESVPAITAFFLGTLHSGHSKHALATRRHCVMAKKRHQHACDDRWEAVCRWVEDVGS